MRVAILTAIVLSLTAPAAFAGSCSSKATGNWNGGTAVTWNAGCTGAGGSPAAADTVTISGGHTVTVTANANAASVSLANSNNTFLTINTGFSLTTTGDVTFERQGVSQRFVIRERYFARDEIGAALAGAGFAIEQEEAWSPFPVGGLGKAWWSARLR